VHTRAHPMDDPTVQLERLENVRSSGGLTQDEFDTAKAQVLRRLMEGSQTTSMDNLPNNRRPENMLD
jgi:hypothetical protein